MCCACLIDLILCNFHLTRQPFYDRIFARLLQNLVKDSDFHEALLKHDKLSQSNFKFALSTSKLKDVDHYVVAPQFGFRSASEYYRKNACGYYLQDIKIPTLIVNSKNDIVVPSQVIQDDDYDGNPNIAAVVTRYGSHGMSWLTGIFSLESWIAQLMIEYFNACLIWQRAQEAKAASVATW